jgi:hypothetical protein
VSGQERPYARVYLDVPDDPRFAEVYGDDAAFAAWVRLLMGAEGAYPASAAIPRSASPEALGKLVAAGLVELVPGDRYRIHGLKAERDRRSAVGRAGGIASGEARRRMNGAANGRATNAERSFDGLANTVAQDEPRTSRDETSRAEPPARAREANGATKPNGNAVRSEEREAEAVPPLEAAAREVERLTGRPWRNPVGTASFETLRADVIDFGLEPVEDALGRAATLAGRKLDAAAITLAAHRLLIPFVDSADLAAKAKAREREQADADRSRRARAEREAEAERQARIRASPAVPLAERVPRPT